MDFNNIKKNAEEALNKAIDGAKDLASKAVDNAEEFVSSDTVKNVKSWRCCWKFDHPLIRQHRLSFQSRKYPKLFQG